MRIHGIDWMIFTRVIFYSMDATLAVNHVLASTWGPDESLVDMEIVYHVIRNRRASFDRSSGIYGGAVA